MLHVYRADRAAALAGALADVLAAPAGSADVLVPEVVAVPSRGIERWLAQELSQRLGTAPGDRDGVCANVRFPFPSTVVRWALAAARGQAVDVHGYDDEPDPWAPRRLLWTLLGVVGEAERAGTLTDELEAFGAHVAGGRGRARRLPALAHVADLLDRYGVHRPDMVRAWHAGADIDGAGAPLPHTARWQPRLWRAARARLGPSFAEQVSAAADWLRAGDAPVDGLPPRLCLYGLTSLPAAHVEVLDALAGRHEIHLFLLHPSPRLWDKVAPVATGDGRPLRTADPSAALAAHPLLRSWGRDSRELQIVLAGRGREQVVPAQPRPVTSLLSLLQDQVRRDVRVDGGPRHALETVGVDAQRHARDTSVQVHACYGQLRQVEVLRDVVLGLLADDHTLQARDIVVMCPDVEAFAPLIDAVFAADARATDGGSDRLPDVRVRLADRALRQVNPLLSAVADLLLLPDGRLEATTVLDLAHRDVVRARFGLGDRDLDTIEGWIAALGVRWGADLAHREAHGLGTDANTWRAGLDRLLLGVAVPQPGVRLVAGTAPYDDVEGDAVDLAGRFAELVARLADLVADLRDPRPIRQWITDLRATVAGIVAVPDEDGWQALQLERLLDDLLADAGGDDAPDIDVTLPELRALLQDALRGRPSRASHRTGDLTVCTLVPMRSVPYRVVCLLGLDDETFPRRAAASGDDLIAAAALVGDRDPRTEDRQLLLDALLAASEHLVITYRARDERTNAPVPPAVPLAELLDVVDAAAVDDHGEQPARALITRHHPLRAADPRNFLAEAPFGFDPLAHAAATSLTAPPSAPPRFLDVLPAPVAGPTTVAWSDFVAALDRPLRTYLRQRLGVSPPGEGGGLDDLLPVTLSGLDEWQVGSRLLAARLAGDLGAQLAVERASGILPVGAIGDAAVATIVASVEEIAERAVARDAELVAAEVTPEPVDLTVGGLHLVGVVDDARPGILARLDYGRTKPKRLLRLWLPWLALAAAGRPRPALLVARGAGGARRAREVARLTRLPGYLSAADARARLAPLAELYARILAEPLPLFSDTSHAFVATEGDRGKRIRAAASSWVTTAWDGRSWGDGVDPDTVLVYGEVALADLLALPATAAETGPGWHEDEPSRFGRLAWRLWGPVVADCATEVVRA